MNNKDLIGIVSDLRETSSSLNVLIKQLTNSNQLEATSISIAKTATQLENFTETLNNKLDAIDIPLYLDLIYNDFNSTVASTNNAIDAVTTKFQSSMMGVNILMEDINKTNKNLNKTLRNINESPYIFLTKPPPVEGIK
jgi:selenophosphate synthase